VLEAGSIPSSPQNFHILEAEALLGLARDLGLRQQQSRRKTLHGGKIFENNENNKTFSKTE